MLAGKYRCPCEANASVVGFSILLIMPETSDRLTSSITISAIEATTKTEHLQKFALIHQLDLCFALR